jgi:hypothetical protein
VQSIAEILPLVLAKLLPPQSMASAAPRIVPEVSQRTFESACA